MRYFKIEQFYIPEFYDCPDVYHYCRVSPVNNLAVFCWEDKEFWTEGNVKADLIQDTLIRKVIYNGKPIDINHIKIVEELTRSQFNKRIKTLTYMEELKD